MAKDVRLACQIDNCLSTKFTVTFEDESGGLLIECADCTASRLFLDDWGTPDDTGF